MVTVARLDSPAHTQWLEAETERLLTFSVGSRHPEGGFAWLDEVGEPDLDGPVQLWITCRMTHVFALGCLLGRSDCVPLVDHGLAALAGRFRDPVNGGWYGSVGAEGPALRDKTAYEHAFVVLAAASATSAGRPGARELLDEALDVVLGRFWDDEQQMTVEQWDETFTELDSYRGVNAAMHTVEALLAAADVTGDRGLLARATAVVSRVVHDLARNNEWRLPEHYDAGWHAMRDYNMATPADPFRPYGATVGHWFEWARLSLHLRAALGSDSSGWMLDDARALFAAAVREGWWVDGTSGFVYTVDWHGRPVVRERMHWVAAEATCTAAALHAATGEPEYADWYRTWWNHIEAAFVDVERGSWHHELDPDNLPSSVVWRGKPDTYHAVQATLVPRVPLAPTLAASLRTGLLD